MSDLNMAPMDKPSAHDETCACGSGRPPDKCCLRAALDQAGIKRRHFELKGKAAEEVVHHLAAHTFQP